MRGMAVQMVELNTSNVCNLKCLTCVRGWEGFQQPRPKYMTLAEFVVVLSRFPGLPKLQICGFSEPTLNNDVPDMIRHAKGMEVPFVEMFTNGTRLREKMAERLATSGLDLLRVSIDGGDEATYHMVRGANLHSVTANVKAFANASGIPVRMESVLSKYTFASAGGLPDVAESAGAKTLAIRLLDGQDRNVAAHHVNYKPALITLKMGLEQACMSKNIQLVMPLPGEEGVMSGCTAWEEVYVDERGRLSPCYMTREQVVGSLLQSTFGEVRRNGGKAYDAQKTLIGGTSQDCSCGYALLVQGKISYSG